MFKIASIFFIANKNLVSLIITIIIIVILYILYLETSLSKNIVNHFFGASFVTIPIVSFYLFYFNYLFRNNYFRFLNLNVSKINFFSYIINSILFLSILITIISIFIYSTLNYIYFNNIYFNFLLLKNIIYFYIFNLFLSSLSFLINSYSTSFWMFLGAIFYFLFEDMLVLFLKQNKINLSDFLPQQNFINIFLDSEWQKTFFIPFIYITFIVILIFKKNYRIL